MTKRLNMLLTVLFILALALPLAAQDAESQEEAKLLLQEAITQKRGGKLEDALKTFEKALRTNRSILGLDDEGLIAALQKHYETMTASSTDDVVSLESLGFIHAVCHSDFDKAITYYKKVLDLTSDEKVKTKTQALIDRLTAQAEMTRSQVDADTQKSRDERVKEWNEMEKQQSLSVVSERIKQREDRLRDLTRSKEELEVRLPQMEDKIKEIEEERDKADLLWRTTENRMYRRKRERLATDIENQKGDIEKNRRKLDTMSTEIEKLTKESEAEQAAMTNSGKPKPIGPGANTPENGGDPDPNATGDPNAAPGTDPSLDPNANPSADPSADPNADPNATPNPDPNGTPDASPYLDPNATPTPTPNSDALPGVGSPDDPALPTGSENPDFPGGESKPNPDPGTQWP